MIFIINNFNTKLAELINNSNLPLDIVTLCLQNHMFQIKIIKLNSKIDELNEIINDDSSNNDIIIDINNEDNKDTPNQV